MPMSHDTHKHTMPRSLTMHKLLTTHSDAFSRAHIYSLYTCAELVKRAFVHSAPFARNMLQNYNATEIQCAKILSQLNSEMLNQYRPRLM